MRRTAGAALAVITDRLDDRCRLVGPAATVAPDRCAAWMDPAKPAEKRADALVAAMSTDQKLHMVTFSDPPWFLYYGTAGHVTGIAGAVHPRPRPQRRRVRGRRACSTARRRSRRAWRRPHLGPVDAAARRPDDRRGGARQGHQRDARPGMNIARTPYNGRNFEYFGEDPFLASQTAVAVIRGIQDNPVIADAKHYAREQPGDRPDDRRRPGRRADDARDLPAGVRGLGEEGRRRLGHVLLQQGQHGVRLREPDAARPSTCARTGASTASSSPTGVPSTPPPRRRTPGWTSRCTPSPCRPRRPR